MLTLHQLSHRYPATHGPATVLRFPDLSLAHGQHLLVRGPSGSGKSTLLALMAGLLTPHRGHVSVGAVVVSQLPARARDAWRGATLGVVPQRLHLSASLSVRDNLELVYLCAGLPIDRARVTHALERLGIADLAARRPHSLSVGQAQRVAVARALLRAPSIILADEPTANLDDTQAQAVMTLLQEAAQDSRASLIVATHDARVATTLAHAQVLALDPLAEATP